MNNPALSRLLARACSDRAWLPSLIDHAVLSPSAGAEEVEKAVEELENLGLRCLITTPTLLETARSLTRRCVGAVAGFPFGYGTIEAKVKEVEDLIGLGADEIDYVANTQRLLLGDRDAYANEIKAVTTICRETATRCKIIIETPILSTAQYIELAAKLAAQAGPDYIKTSTGYAPRPTHPEDVAIIASTLERLGASKRPGIKAAGGIRTPLQALLMIAVGADIIGTSRPAQLLQQLDTICQHRSSATST